jgi:hypothetical protein
MTACVSMLLKSRASPDMLPFSPCSKKKLAIRHTNLSLTIIKEEWEIAISEFLIVQKPYFYQNGILKAQPKRDKCINMSVNCVEN